MAEPLDALLQQIAAARAAERASRSALDEALLKLCRCGYGPNVPRLCDCTATLSVHTLRKLTNAVYWAAQPLVRDLLEHAPSITPAERETYEHALVAIEEATR